MRRGGPGGQAARAAEVSSRSARHMSGRETCLDLDVAFATSFVAVGAVPPPLDEVARSGASCELKIRGGGSLCGGQFGTRLQGWRSPSERVCFPLAICDVNLDSHLEEGGHGATLTSGSSSGLYSPGIHGTVG